MAKIKSVNPQRIELVTKLRKKASESKQNIWKDLVKRLDRTRKHRVVVNVDKLNILAGKNPGKVLLVPGKVLGKGVFEQKTIIAAVEFSPKARESIVRTGKAVNLSDLMEMSENPSNIMIVK